MLFGMKNIYIYKKKKEQVIKPIPLNFILK